MTASRTCSSRPLLSPQACLVSCFQQLMVETCSCGYLFYPLPSGAEYCSSARHPAWGESPPPGRCGGPRSGLANLQTSPPPRVDASAFICDNPPCPAPPQVTASTGSPGTWGPTGFPVAHAAPGPAGGWLVWGLGVRGYCHSTQREGNGASVSPRESSYKLSAGTSRWPSSKSAVSALKGWVGGGPAGGSPRSRGLTLDQPVPCGPRSEHLPHSALRLRGTAAPGNLLCRTGSWPCWASEATGARARPLASGGCTPPPEGTSRPLPLPTPSSVTPAVRVPGPSPSRLCLAAGAAWPR